MKYFLIILAFLPLFVQSQDTIKIPVPVAKQIVKDLVSGDSAKAELKLTSEHIELLHQKITLKDSIIAGREKQLVLCDERLANEVKKFDTQGLWVKQLQKENKRLKVKFRFLQITGAAIIGTLTYLYITK
jgi:hypothetical protein